MLTIVALVLAADLGNPKDLPEQENALKVAKYFTDAVASGDRETLIYLADADSLAARKGDPPRSALNAYAARLNRGACATDEDARTNKKTVNELKEAGKDVAGVRLFCAGGKYEDMKLRKAGTAWKVVIP